LAFTTVVLTVVPVPLVEMLAVCTLHQALSRRRLAPATVSTDYGSEAVKTEVKQS
jgi:hypothetical protein